MSTAGAHRPDENNHAVNAPGSAGSSPTDISWKRKKIIIGAFIVLAAVLLVWSAEVFIVKDSSVNNGTLIEKSYNSTLLEKPVRMPVSEPESRYVWAADAGASKTFNLTPMNFDGFYYDPDNNAGSESFSIKLENSSDRTIKENDLIYSTTGTNVPFKYRSFGNYSVIGFMGERYLAGYGADSSIAQSPVNLLTHGLLSKILIDENLDHTLIPGSSLALNEGYAIWVNDVNNAEGTALISLKNKGEEVERRSVKAGNTFVYKKDIIAMHIDSVLPDKNSPAVGIKGVFQLSDTYTKIEMEPDYWIYGIMKITNVSEKGISMANKELLNLRYPYSTEFELYSLGIIGNIGLKVADSDILRFCLDREPLYYENLERHGAVYTKSNKILAWDGLNFAGFLYDLDSGNYSEKLEITDLSGRTIPANNLIYTAFVTEIPFAVTKKTGMKPSGTNGSYKAVGFGADKYAALKGKSSLLTQILIDNGKDLPGKKTLMDGEIWNMGDGYNLTVKSVNAGSTLSRPRANAELALGRNGIEFDEKWISQGSIFTYSKDNSSDEKDFPVFITYLDSILSGSSGLNFIQLRYTWLLSDNVTEIKEGDRFGVFRVMRVEPDFIVLENDRPIDLSARSCIRLMGNLSFVVADSDELRFYPSRGKKCD